MKNKKDEFPLLQRLENNVPICYLDSAATTQKPQQVLDAIIKAYTAYNANPGRGIYQLAEQATQQYENARKTVANFIGAKPDEVVFVSGATEGINAIAQGWARYNITAGDEIVLSELEHHSNLLPWQRVAHEVGAHLKFIPILPDGFLDMSVVASLITRKTKLVAITHSSNAIGTPVELQPIVTLAKKVGAKVLVDACQSAPHMPIDVKKIGCDFLVFSGHKMLGPTGIGVLYISSQLHDSVQPFALGGGMVFEVNWHTYSLVKAPHKFEAGTPPFIQAIGLAEAIKYLEQNVPFDDLQAYEAMLCNRLIEGLSQIDSITILGPIDELKKQGHVVTFVVDGVHAHDVAAYLDKQGICVRAGHFCAQPLLKKLGHDAAVRASFYCYTQRQDIDRLIEAMQCLQGVAR